VWDEELDEKKSGLLIKIWKGKERRRKGERGRKRKETKDKEGKGEMREEG